MANNFNTLIAELSCELDSPILRRASKDAVIVIEKTGDLMYITVDSTKQRFRWSDKDQKYRHSVC